MPRLGSAQNIAVEVTSLPREEYHREGYIRSGLPAAPAIMIDEEVLIQGADLEEELLLALLAARLR